MQNPQRLVFQQSPEKGEGMGRENIGNKTPEAGTDAKNVVSQAHAKLEHFFEDTTVSQLYKQIQEARKKEDESFKEKGFVSAEESNAIFHMMEELVQLTPRNEEEKDIVLEQIDYIDRNGSQYYAIGPKYNALQDRKKEVKAMQFLTVTDLRDRIGPISSDDPYGAKGIAMREQLIQLTPHTETERQMILEEIAYLNQFGSAYQSEHPDGPKNQVALDKRRKEVESLKFN